MDRLEACYFCGTAEDAPLREVTVTPRRRRDDPDAAVALTLCRSCERKLERVLTGLFEHVESRPRAEGGGDAEPADEAEPADDEPATEPEPVDRIDVAPSRSDEGRRELFSDPPVPAVEDEPDVGAGGDAEPADADDAEEDDAEIVDEEPVTARATVSSTDALDGVSVSEYNKVMRLLQNREFPMARGAFVDLAANAYDLGEDAVESVLDAVIDQGALADRDGELVRPGESA